MVDVYVLERGERYEGSWIIGIYSTYELALAAVPKAQADSTWYPGDWELESEDYWTNGIDYISICRFTLDSQELIC